MTEEKPKLHPAEHRAYRELYASARHLAHRWSRLAGALEGTAVGESLERGAGEAERLASVRGSQICAPRSPIAAATRAWWCASPFWTPTT